MSKLHRVWKVGADVDTDQLAPGAYMKLGIHDIAKHCLEGVRPEFAAELARAMYWQQVPILALVHPESRRQMPWLNWV